MRKDAAILTVISTLISTVVLPAWFRTMLTQPARANTHTHTRTHGSNYCGSTGNYGAVVVFQSDLSYTVEEHMAPELSEASARRRGLVRGTGLTRRRGAVREWRGNSEGRVLVRGPWTRIRDSDT